MFVTTAYPFSETRTRGRNNRKAPFEIRPDPLQTELCRRNIKCIFAFWALPNTKAAQVVEIFLFGRQGPLYHTTRQCQTAVSWRRKEPGHQQPWC